MPNIDYLNFNLYERLGSPSAPIVNVSVKEQVQPYKCTEFPVKKKAELIALSRLPDTSTIALSKVDTRVVVQSTRQPKINWRKWDKLSFYACAGSGVFVLAGFIIFGLLGSMGLGGAVMIGLAAILLLPAIGGLELSNDTLPMLQPQNQLPATIFVDSNRRDESSEVSTVDTENDNQFSVTAF